MLYRTYRPETWDEVVGQEHVVQTLRGAIKSGRFGQAYLFAGPRGTGKTTVARIFARELMGGGDDLDLIEIDAASYGTIDHIRDLKETAGVAAVGGGYKIYLFDEAHMISKGAFNAFLKLLEEPPSHVIFILATTEVQKIMPTILSRVQRFDFKRLTPDQITTKLKTVAKAEKLSIEPEALAMLAGAADGALRDAEVMLTKLAGAVVSDSRTITASTVQSVLGLVPAAWHFTLATAIAGGDRTGALRFLHEVTEQGADADQLVKGFLEYLRAVMIAKIDPALVSGAKLAMAQPQHDQLLTLAATMDGKLLVRAIQSFTTARVQIKSSPIPLLPLELAVIELTQKRE